MHTKKRTKRVIGYCWCGGRLFKLKKEKENEGNQSK
jgi:hypothetical protein